MQAPCGFKHLCSKVTLNTARASTKWIYFLSDKVTFIAPRVSTTSLINRNLNTITVKVDPQQNVVIAKVGAKMQLKSGAKSLLAAANCKQQSF